MTVDDIRDYCLNKPGTTEGFPFGDSALVFKRDGKVYAILSLTDAPPWINLKCDPDRALQLRDEYDFVEPGYHMNKRHWNTVRLVPELSDDLLRGWIDHSYELVGSLRK